MAVITASTGTAHHDGKFPEEYLDYLSTDKKLSIPNYQQYVNNQIRTTPKFQQYLKNNNTQRPKESKVRQPSKYVEPQSINIMLTIKILRIPIYEQYVNHENYYKTPKSQQYVLLIIAKTQQYVNH